MWSNKYLWRPGQALGNVWSAECEAGLWKVSRQQSLIERWDKNSCWGRVGWENGVSPISIYLNWGGEGGVGAHFKVESEIVVTGKNSVLPSVCCFPACLFHLSLFTAHFTSEIFGYQVCGGFSPYQQILCDTSLATYSLTQFWHYQPRESIRVHRWRLSPTMWPPTSGDKCK